MWSSDPFVFSFIILAHDNFHNKMKKKTDKIKVGQRYEHKGYFEDPFERGKHVIKILDIKEGYALYEYEEKLYIRSSESLEDIVKKYILITDIK